MAAHFQDADDLEDIPFDREYQTPSSIQLHRKLAGSISLEGMTSQAGQRIQVVQSFCGLQNVDSLDISPGDRFSPLANGFG
jgi:hypothetical protein